ncbi:unnamed protein product [Caenorhabditis auriculariae]|uniref:Uncharacterized protein n=1 Tax=Caenorhabditis auriculariae TaxID=2777116 RepID=A0A8S1HT78_9PELO|nr:unnamed protein product [Caenorhabditis auriculariae]
MTEACLQTVPSDTTTTTTTTVATDTTTTPTSTSSTSTVSTTTSSTSTSTSTASTTTTTTANSACSANTLTRAPDPTMDEVPATLMFAGTMVIGSCPLPDPNCIASMSVYDAAGNQFSPDPLPFTFVCDNGQILYNGIAAVGIFCVFFC